MGMRTGRLGGRIQTLHWIISLVDRDTVLGGTRRQSKQANRYVQVAVDLSMTF